MSADRIDLSLTKAEALVFFEWLCNLKAGASPPPEPAEQKVLWRVEALLERALSEPLDPNYRQLLEQAKQSVLSME